MDSQRYVDTNDFAVSPSTEETLAVLVGFVCSADRAGDHDHDPVFKHKPASVIEVCSHAWQATLPLGSSFDSSGAGANSMAVRAECMGRSNGWDDTTAEWRTLMLPANITVEPWLW
jgi:hypothetical protein